MEVYCEITLLPNPEVNINFLWSKVFQQIHLGLVEMKNDQGFAPIGVAFPEYVTENKFRILGCKCRLFAKDNTTLAKFDASKWLARLNDYAHCTSIRPVPDKVQGYACYQRVQPKTNAERLARRYASRHGMDLATTLNTAIQLKDAPNAGYPQTYRS